MRYGAPIIHATRGFLSLMASSLSKRIEISIVWNEMKTYCNYINNMNSNIKKTICKKRYVAFLNQMVKICKIDS